MNIRSKLIFLSGATGGLGRCLAREFAAQGATLALSARDTRALDELAAEYEAAGVRVETFPADLSRPREGERLASRVREVVGVPDVLVHNAGMNSFGRFREEPVRVTEDLFHVNVLAAMAVTGTLLPDLVTRGSGRIVGVGSTFGSLAFPYFASYSASKFALRGFTEALRRELEGTGVGVTYVAPRAMRTAMTSPYEEFSKEARMNVDDPRRIAQGIVRAIERDASTATFGWPERAFTRVNALAPGLVDRGLRRTRAQADAFLERDAARADAASARSVGGPAHA